MISRRRRALAGSDDGSKGIASMLDDIEPEPFEEMYSIFRIVTLYELMIHGQWKYVVHYLDNKKTELVLGTYIGAAFELIRFVCVLIIAIVFILMRISALLPLQNENIIGNITWVISTNALAFWTALILCAIIVAQFAVYQCKNSSYVVICTTINFVFSIILIAAFIHLAILRYNNENFMKEGFHKNLLSSGSMRGLQNYQARVKCCGVEGPDDYFGSIIMKYTNATSTSETKTDDVHRICSQRNLTVEEAKEAREYAQTGNWQMMHTFISRPEPGSYWSKGCLNEYVESVESYINVLISTLIIFTMFTALTIGFVIVLLLYHDGVGQIVSDQKMFGVERNTGVHFLMSLDMIDSDFQDDFSLIEFLRKSDIDNFMAGDRLKATISGRKEAERA
ncbi:Protein CBR-TSP-19 [Caenorhabditis briggsae]|uniref:Protein CBR-TSP-19 n=1 Tax=Caenorhabditis briggsae TaxID=6238 RepID=A8XGC2_CAEBR|nr:Protein CBR-TSP-19 [Caenorhabditis briggsae]CAP31628.2 Protein CBR-TSP-19 [Caenorhabditis briggsae]